MQTTIKSILLKYKGVFIFSLFIVTFLTIYLTTQKQRKNRIDKILKSAAFTTGKFTGEVKPVKKGSNGPWYVFEYNVKEKTYQTSEPIHLFDNFNMKYFYRTFPVIYDSTNPGNVELLIFPFEFEQFKFKYPDSLKSRLNKY
jgi:hypothetical protein